MITPEKFIASLPFRKFTDTWNDLYRALSERYDVPQFFFPAMKLFDAEAMEDAFGQLFNEIASASERYLENPSGINPSSYCRGEFKYCHLISCLEKVKNPILPPPPEPFERSLRRIPCRLWPFLECHYETLDSSRLKKQRAAEYFRVAAEILHQLRYYALVPNPILHIPRFTPPKSMVNIYFIQYDRLSRVNSRSVHVDRVFRGHLAPGRYTPGEFDVDQIPGNPNFVLAGYIDLADSLEYFDPSSK